MPRCDFRESQPRESWAFAPGPGRMRAPSYGAGQDGIAPGGRRAVRRCPACGKRLTLRAIYCIGGEFTSWAIPEHVVRKTRRPGVRRKSRASGRGK